MNVSGTVTRQGPAGPARLRTILTTTVSAAACIAGAQGTAHAQASESTVGLREIIVTAQKREQSIQDVPVAVTALGTEAIEANRIEDAADLTGLAPGLVAKQTAGALGAISFAMRGVNANPSAPLQDKEISMYIDGVYIGGSRGTLGELMEVDRIEVLRGPQGTLFGRNSTAGAVNIVTRNPTGEMAFRQDLTYGNLDQLRTRTTIDTPAFGPFSAYVTYIHDESRGDVRNLGAGTVWDRTNPFTKVGVQTSPKWIGGRNYENVFAALRYDDGGDFKATYKFDWSKGKFTGNARVTPVINTFGDVFGPAQGFPDYTYYPATNVIGTLLAQIIAAQPAGGGAFGPVTLNPNDRRPKAANQAFATNGSQRVQGHSLTLEWQASDNLVVKNIAAYRKNRVFSGGTSIAGLSGLEFTPGSVTPYADFVGVSAIPGYSFLATREEKDAALAAALGPTFLPGLNFIANAGGYYFAPYEGQSYGTHRQYSDELQVNYSTDKLNLTTGLLYFQSKTIDSGLPGYTPNVQFGPIPTTIPQGTAAPGIGAQYALGKTKSYAAYAQLEYQFTDQIGVIAGGRWTKDDKRGVFRSGGIVTGDMIDFTIAPPDGRFKKSKFTYSLGANFQPADNILAYAKYSTGFLSGGIYADIPFAPETAKSWEAGIKTDFWDRRIRFNVAAYTVDYNNYQSATSGRGVNRPDLPIAVVTNGTLKAKGVEVDLNIAPLDGLSFGGTVGYTKNKLVDPAPNLAQGYDIKATGQPKWVGTANAQYVTPPLYGGATLLFRADVAFQSKTRVLGAHQVAIDFPAFAPYEFMPAKQIVNARVALQNVEIGGAEMELAVWSKNLFDSKKPIYAFQYPYFLMTTSYERARTVGVDLIFKYKP